MKNITLLITLLVAAFALFSLTIHAQVDDSAGIASAMQDSGGQVESPDIVTGFITGMASKYPWVVTVMSLIGLLRIFCKPLMTAIETWVKSTPSTTDDAMFEKVEHSSAYKAFSWLLDLFGSVKIGPQFTAKAVPPAQNPPQTTA